MIETQRLLLRGWRDDDLKPFAEMNADARVMRYFPATLTEEETRSGMHRMIASLEQHGFCFWAAEIKESHEFAGFIGLSVPSFEAHFTPCVEIGWRLRAEFWNRGLATEGARAALRWGFSSRELHEIVSFTASGNLASRRVMEKIGMRRNPEDDFDYPSLPEGHPLLRHVLYRTP